MEVERHLFNQPLPARLATLVHEQAKAERTGQPCRLEFLPTADV